MLDNIGVTVDTRKLTQLSRLARSYGRTPRWLRWLRPRAKEEWLRCKLLRQLEIMSLTMDASLRAIAEDAQAVNERDGVEDLRDALSR
jgi:cell division inhibitor SulA